MTRQFLWPQKTPEHLNCSLRRTKDLTDSQAGGNHRKVREMSSQNLDGVQGAYAAFATGDVPAVLGFLSADIEWTEAEGFPYGGTYTGPNAVLEGVFMRLGTEWDGFAAVPEEFIDAGDTVVALGKYSGTYKATGKSFQAAFAHVWKLRDGQAVKFVQYTDTLKVQEALK